MFQLPNHGKGMNFVRIYYNLFRWDAAQEVTGYKGYDNSEIPI